MPPLKFRAAGFPQHGFKYGFGYDLRHWSHRLNLPWYSLRSLCLIHILRLSSSLLLFLSFPGFRQSEPPQPSDNHPSPRGPSLWQGYIVPIVFAITASSASLYRFFPISLSDYTKSPCHSRAILTAIQTFPTLTVKHCMIVTCFTPGVLNTVRPICYIFSSNHRPDGTGLATPS